MPSISAVIITKNEEANIARCLQSLEGIVDEIIVFDSQSTDNTVEICNQFGALVTDATWRGYSQTKNEANAAASHEFILSIDADEALSEQLKAGILHVKEALHGAYSCNRLNNYCGKWMKHGGYYPDRKVRLFDRNLAHWEGDHVHETLVLHEGANVQHLPGDLLHYTYTTSQDHEQRAQKYARLAAEKLKGKGSGVLFFKLLFSPVFRFLKRYLLQGGFLDGSKGLSLHYITAKEVYWKYKWALKGGEA